MKRDRIRSEICLNCGEQLSNETNYCPSCGQENDNKRQPLSHILLDLFQNFLSLDSKVLRSLKPLILRPGKLTLEFIEGKRKRYLHPARMFLTIVVGYFLIGSFEFNDVSELDKNVPVVINIDSSGVFLKSDTITVDTENLDELADSLLTELDPVGSGEVSAELSGGYNELKRLVKSGVTDPVQVLDSLGKENTLKNRIVYSWLIKTVDFDQESFKDYIIQKLPWIIFALMPVFALLLNMFYWRKQMYYIDHLIFSFHLHSFVFLVFILSTVVGWITDYDHSLVNTAIILWYCLVSFRKVYSQSWKRTTLKLTMLLLTYFLCVVICGLIFIAIAFMAY